MSTDATNIDRNANRCCARGHSLASVTDKISSIVLARGLKRGWIVGLVVSFRLVMLLLVSVA